MSQTCPFFKKRGCLSGFRGQKNGWIFGRKIRIFFRNFAKIIQMVIIFFRALIIFAVLVVIMRLMGKRQIGEMQPFEFIITLLIAELACVPMTDVSIPLIYGIVSVVAVFIIHQALTLLEHKSHFFRKMVNGKPSVVINRMGVDLKELKNNNMDVFDLVESLRATGNFSLDGVCFAIYESNGKLSVMPNPDFEDDAQMPVILIAEGRLYKKNLRALKLGPNRLLEFLKQNGVKSTGRVDVMTVAPNGKVYLQPRGKKYKILNIEIESGVIW